MDDSRQPLISVIIPTVHSRTLELCLASARQALAEVSHEIIVVPDQGFGVSEARNQGLEKATGQYFLLIDDDCMLESPVFVRQIIERARTKEALHGGRYNLRLPASYWAQTYAVVTELWLQRGQGPKGSHKHLLGGFLFGSRIIKNQMNFAHHLKWGGEEKELLMRLSQIGIKGQLHSDLKISHIDESGIGKFVKRAVLQGIAAGLHDLYTPFRKHYSASIPVLLWPGLILFFMFSRIGILAGKVKSIFGSKSKMAESSPTA